MLYPRCAVFDLPSHRNRHNHKTSSADRPPQTKKIKSPHPKKEKKETMVHQNHQTPHKLTNPVLDCCMILHDSEILPEEQELQIHQKQNPRVGTHQTVITTHTGSIGNSREEADLELQIWFWKPEARARTVVQRRTCILQGPWSSTAGKKKLFGEESGESKPWSTLCRQSSCWCCCQKERSVGKAGTTTCAAAAFSSPRFAAHACHFTFPLIF